jgi:hypothetical protein
MNQKYTKEVLRNLVSESTSVSDVMRKLGIKRSGGSHSHITRRLKYFGIDISHFTGKTLSKGRPSRKKKSPDQILILNTTGNREDTIRLRRSLIEIGVEYVCSLCKIPPIWNNKELRLHVDHVNKNWSDNRKENLRFLCPNCHSQTDGYCGSKGLSDVVSDNRRQQIYRKTKIMAL